MWRTCIGICLLVACAVRGSAFAAGVDEAPTYPWPNGTRAAVSLAYDDAVPSQLDTALPALDRYGLKGSFYLTLSADTVHSRLPEWRAAAHNGHELGNHSLFHQCSATGGDRAWVSPAQDLDTMTVARMQAEVVLGNAMLHAIDGSTAFTFTVPCGDRITGDGDYVDGLHDHFLGIKVGAGAVVPDMRQLDRMAVPIVAPQGSTGAELIALVEAAGRRGTMVNITFHGIGADHLSVSSEAHEALLAFLDAHRDRYWTATFRDQMRWIRDQSHAGD